MGYLLSDPPTEDEVEGLVLYVSQRVWPSFEEGAIHLTLRGPEGEKLVAFLVRPTSGRSWSGTPIVEVIEAFAASLGQLSELIGSTPGTTAQTIVDRLEQHAQIVCRRYEGVEIERGAIYSLDTGDWLGP